MTQLSDIPPSQDPTHLLLIGLTKMGKSTYCAQAVLDGWPMLYIDSDNGLSALRNALAGNVEAQRRVYYFGTENPASFIESMLTAKGVFRWNITQDKEFQSFGSKPSDRVAEIRPTLIPSQLILTVDSWSAAALDAMEIGAANKRTELEKMVADNKAQGVYNDAGWRLTLLLAVLQKVSFHTIIQAHPAYYERLEKPANMKAADIKQGDMIVKDTIEIPLSCSKPHGFTMGKYFTDIGWLELNRMDERIIDFTARYGRISGGVVNRKGSIENLPFSKTFGLPVEPYDPDNQTWIRYLTAEEFTAEQEAAKSSKPKPAGVSASGVIQQKPAAPMMASLVKK